MNFTENDLLFARQPIFDGKNKLYGFEMLYRNLNPTAAVFDDGNRATSELLINYCGGILNDEASPYVKTFINLTRKLLLSDYFFPLDPNRVVLEILENIKADDVIINKIIELKSKGFVFAIDDFNFGHEQAPLFPYVGYIKVDLLKVPRDELEVKVVSLEKNVLSRLPKKPILLAEKVEDRETYNFCRDLGFELFQGYFLERPQLVYGKKINNSGEIALQILAQLQESNVDIDKLCHSISRDTKMSYQLLKIINSPLCRLPRRVNSLKEAVVFLGLDQVKKWAMAMVLSGNNTAGHELFRILLTRARTCELFATAKKHDKTDSFFTVGLFSGIDAVMMADKRWLIEKLDLAADMNQAILKEEGCKGEVLKQVLALERADWQVTSQMSDEDQIELFSAHENAINWAHQICSMV